MDNLMTYTKAVLLALVVGAVGLAMYPSESEAAAGVTCYDEGHACHVSSEGEIHHYGKFQEN